MHKAWKENQGILFAPVMAMVVAGLAGTMLAIAALYNVAFNAETARLREIVQSQVRLIEAVARFDIEQSKDFPGGARAATISQIVAAHQQNREFSSTGLLAVAERKDDQIVSIFPFADGSHRRTAWKSRLTEPMRQALSGVSGIMIGPDYRGMTVLAAHAPVPALGLGVVAKIDMAEIRAPFIRAGLYALAATLVLIVIAALTSTMITRPLLQELIGSRNEALQANLAKSQFLANMSHELRTPLNAIIGFTDMMRLQVLGPLRPGPYDGYLDSINVSGQRLLFLVSDILEMARIESGNYVLSKEWIDVKEIMIEAARVVNWRIADGDISVIWDICPGLPAVEADRRAIKLVLVNLLHNAAKFTPRQGTITLKAEVAGKTMCISVSDTGIGIRPEDMERAFLPFAQIERERNHFHEGAGLGLALSMSLVEMHGGAIFMTSTLGKGATVNIALPLSKPPPAAKAKSMRAKPSRPDPGIAWLPAMSVGVKKWDQDHRALLDLINDLRAAGGFAAHGMIETLAGYTDIHLQSEERVMKALGYRLLAEHREKHDEFRQWFANIRLAKNDPLTCQHPGEMTDYLQHWLCSHILVTDMNYKEFFAARRQEVSKALKNYQPVSAIQRRI